MCRDTSREIRDESVEMRASKERGRKENPVIKWAGGPSIVSHTPVPSLVPFLFFSFLCYILSEKDQVQQKHTASHYTSVVEGVRRVTPMQDFFLLRLGLWVITFLRH
mmetsp:Transcript_50291/g.99035  ORF Transcript_50291/g.99035 Transcript_50291/m.99035 type:complete len:107 (+) Transcript_50291:2095-2415(+)